MIRRSLLSISGAALLLLSANSQLTRQDFQRAHDVPESYRNRAAHMPVEAHWIEGEHALLVEQLDQGKLSFRVYDEGGQSEPAFDLHKLAASLNAVAHSEVKEDSLPIRDVRLAVHRTRLTFSIGYDPWQCDLPAYRCERPHEEGAQNEDPNVHPEARNSRSRQLASPDGKWKAIIVNYNVTVLSADGAQTVTLSSDGSEGNYYDYGSLAWSPDSKHLAAFRVRPGYRRMVRFIDSSPENQLQPLYPEVVYTKPGDTLDLQQPVLFDMESHAQHEVVNSLFPNPYELSPPVWWNDSRGFTFEYNARGHQSFRVIEVNGTTGMARVLVDESSPTFVDYRRLVPNQQDTGKVYRDDIDDGRRILWASERDGWEHLYWVDSTNGQLTQITRGEWVVRSVDRVDESSRTIYFSASGRNSGEDPYNVHAYAIRFDGTGLQELTSGPANHHVEYSDDGALFFDLASTVQQAPVLKSASVAAPAKGHELLRGDLQPMLAAGWLPPEPFHAVGRDGKTEIWGIVWKPANFDPKKRYPVVEDIYAGPQGSFVPKSFVTRTPALTQLGFVVVQIDGMGTNNRSKAFHNVIWKNLKDGGFEDRILWHRAFSSTHAWYDVSRVGIYGTSAGGQNAMGALLFHPDFYKAAVANSGCHDNRMDKIWWNEQWMGWPVGPEYAASSNVENAWRLQGKLMLVVGELDDNVDPASTFQVVDRLEKAKKEFELLYVPGGHHGAGGEYGERKLESFFVRSLLQDTVPDWNAVQ